MNVFHRDQGLDVLLDLLPPLEGGQLDYDPNIFQDLSLIYICASKTKHELVNVFHGDQGFDLLLDLLPPLKSGQLNYDPNIYQEMTLYIFAHRKQKAS